MENGRKEMIQLVDVSGAGAAFRAHFTSSDLDDSRNLKYHNKLALYIHSGSFWEGHMEVPEHVMFDLKTACS